VVSSEISTGDVVNVHISYQRQIRHISLQSVGLVLNSVTENIGLFIFIFYFLKSTMGTGGYFR
jgi:hypothetical protein